jgi:3-oxoacyl-[acyl-carrier-protein] synthase III
VFKNCLENKMNILEKSQLISDATRIHARCMPMQARIRIAGTGSYLPPNRTFSADIDVREGRKIGKTEERTGVRERPVAIYETSSFMATEAARAAVESANIDLSEVDLILSACAVPEQPIPAMAPMIQAGLGLGKSAIPAFDINASCLSFVIAFDLAAQLIEAGRFRNVLVVSSEIASRALPWRSDVDTAAMFGDGAAAALITSCRGGAGGLVASLMETWSEGYHDCELPSGGTRFDFHNQHSEFSNGAEFRMDGRAAYRLAAKVIQPFMEKLLAKAGWHLDEVDLVVPHQASRGALDHLVAKLRIGSERIVDIIADHGNQISASIPMALNYAVRRGHLTSGSKVLLIGTSAGFSVGGLCLLVP